MTFDPRPMRAVGVGGDERCDGSGSDSPFGRTLSVGSSDALTSCVTTGSGPSSDQLLGRADRTDQAHDVGGPRGSARPGPRSFRHDVGGIRQRLRSRCQAWEREASFHPFSLPAGYSLGQIQVCAERWSAGQDRRVRVGQPTASRPPRSEFGVRQVRLPGLDLEPLRRLREGSGCP